MKGKILIIDDVSYIRMLLRHFFEKLGDFTIEERESGMDVLPVIQNDSFDLLLLDLNLPEKDGHTVLQEMKTAGISLPVIVVTATYQTLEELEPLGVRAVLNKPVDFDQLEQVVQNLLS